MLITISKSLFEYVVRECIYTEVEKVFLAVGVVEEGVTRVLEVVECRNIAENPRVEFVADPQCMYRVFKYAEGKGLDIVALVHSHPAPPHPSALDIKGMRLWSTPWIIVDSRNGSAKAWILKNGVTEIPIQVV